MRVETPTTGGEIAQKMLYWRCKFISFLTEWLVVCWFVLHSTLCILFRKNIFPRASLALLLCGECISRKINTRVFHDYFDWCESTEWRILCFHFHRTEIDKWSNVSAFYEPQREGHLKLSHKHPPKINSRPINNNKLAETEDWRASNDADASNKANWLSAPRDTSLCHELRCSDEPKHNHQMGGMASIDRRGQRNRHRDFV